MSNKNIVKIEIDRKEGLINDILEICENISKQTNGGDMQIRLHDKTFIFKTMEDSDISIELSVSAGLLKCSSSARSFGIIINSAAFKCALACCKYNDIAYNIIGLEIDLEILGSGYNKVTLTNGIATQIIESVNDDLNSISRLGNLENNWILRFNLHSIFNFAKKVSDEHIALKFNKNTLEATGYYTRDNFVLLKNDFEINLNTYHELSSKVAPDSKVKLPSGVYALNDKILTVAVLNRYIFAHFNQKNIFFHRKEEDDKDTTLNFFLQTPGNIPGKPNNCSKAYFFATRKFNSGVINKVYGCDSDIREEIILDKVANKTVITNRNSISNINQQNISSFQVLTTSINGIGSQGGYLTNQNNSTKPQIKKEKFLEEKNDNLLGNISPESISEESDEEESNRNNIQNRNYNQNRNISNNLILPSSNTNRSTVSNMLIINSKLKVEENKTNPFSNINSNQNNNINNPFLKPNENNKVNLGVNNNIKKEDDSSFKLDISCILKNESELEDSAKDQISKLLKEENKNNKFPDFTNKVKNDKELGNFIKPTNNLPKPTLINTCLDNNKTVVNKTTNYNISKMDVSNNKPPMVFKKIERPQNQENTNLINNIINPPFHNIKQETQLIIPIIKQNPVSNINNNLNNPFMKVNNNNNLANYNIASNIISNNPPLNTVNTNNSIIHKEIEFSDPESDLKDDKKGKKKES